MKRFVVFGLASIIGACIDFGIGLYLLGLGLPGWMALALAMSVSLVVVYAIHQRVTFSDISGRAFSARRLSLFALNTVAVYALRVLVFEVLSNVGFVQAVALGIALVSSLAVNFLVSRTLIFGGKP